MAIGPETTTEKRVVLPVRVLDLTEAEAAALQERLGARPGVRYADVDAASGFVEVEYESPFAAVDALEILRSVGNPVLTDPVCC